MRPRASLLHLAADSPVASGPAQVVSNSISPREWGNDFNASSRGPQLKWQKLDVLLPRPAIVPAPGP